VKSFVMKRLVLLTLLVLLAVSLVPSSVLAKDQAVRAVLFFSPTCGHCEKVITQVLPPLQSQYGSRLEIAQVDVTQPEGQALYQAVLQQYNVSDDRVGVPTLLVGQTVLVGDVEIPAELPKIIEQGLSAGGISWPDLPGLSRWIQAGPNSEDGPIARMLGKFNRDPAGNTLAIVVLLVMIASVIGVAIDYAKGVTKNERRWPAWLIPLLCLIGLFVAFYLSFVEVTKTQALCGPIGDCNSVQQSPYARLFGILPVGILGLFGYLAILAAWLTGQWGKRQNNETLVRYADLAVWAMAWFGILFSIYLTFLEPFVIGATCIWCITQAIVMTLMLWVTTGPAKQATETEEDDFAEDDFEEDPAV
jgi:uncharacterized membrane protein